MTYFNQSLKAFILCLLLSTSNRSYAQYVSPYDNKGNVKSIESRRSEESVNSQRNAEIERNRREAAARKSSTSTSSSAAASSKTNSSYATTSTSRFTYVGKYINGLANVENSSGEWGCIDESDNVVIPLVYLESLYFYEGVAVAAVDKGIWYGSTYLGEKRPKIYGYISNKGKTIIPFIYSKASKFSEGLAVVEKNGLLNVIDKNGNTVVSTNLVYTQSYSFSGGLCAFQRSNSLWGFINTRGEVVIPAIYDIGGFFANGKTGVLLNGKKIFIDKTGKEVGENELIVEKAIVYQQATSTLGVPGKNEEVKKSQPEEITKWDAAILKGIDDKAKSLVGTMAPDFIQTDVNGKPVSLSSFKGKYVLIYFWMSGSDPCIKENSDLVEIYRDLNNSYSRKLEIIGISLDAASQKEKWKKIIQDQRLVWTQLCDFKGWHNDVAKLYQVTSVPMNFLLDPDGKIIKANLHGNLLKLVLAAIIIANG